MPPTSPGTVCRLRRHANNRAFRLAVYSAGLKFLLEDSEHLVFEPGLSTAESSRFGSWPGDASLLGYVTDVATEFLSGELPTRNADLNDENIETLRSRGYLELYPAKYTGSELSTLWRSWVTEQAASVSYRLRCGCSVSPF